MPMNFKVSILPSEDNTFSLGSSTKRWKINDKDIFDAIYPVGSIYMSINSTSPVTLFGGAWERIKDTFLLASGDVYAADSSGGSATVTLDTTQIPSHTHTGPSHTHTGPSHTHTYDKSATATGGNNSATAGPSNNTSGSTAITVAQMPSHNHGSSTGAHKHDIEWPDGNAISLNDGSYTGYHLTWASNRGSTLIRTRDLSGHGAHTHTSQGSGSGHTHTLSSHTHTMSSHTHSITLTSTNSGASGTGNTGAAGTGATGATGGGGAHNNMPPYITVYIWKRTA